MSSLTPVLTRAVVVPPDVDQQKLHANTTNSDICAADRHTHNPQMQSDDISLDLASDCGPLLCV